MKIRPTKISNRMTMKIRCLKLITLTVKIIKLIKINKIEKIKNQKIKNLHQHKKKKLIKKTENQDLVHLEAVEQIKNK